MTWLGLVTVDRLRTGTMVTRLETSGALSPGAGEPGLVDEEDEQKNYQECTLRTPTVQLLGGGHGPIEGCLHAPVGEVGDDEPEGTGGDVQLSQQGDQDHRGHPVEPLGEINQSGHDSSGVVV